MASNEVGELKIKLSFDTKALDNSQKEAESKIKGGYSIAKNVVANFATQAIQKVGSVVKSVGSVGMEFDAAMSQVSAVSGATGDDLLALRDKAKEMGASTKFTATQSAEAFNYMAMAGWDTTQMLDGIEGVMNLAAASGADLATTSDIVTDALTAMGYGAADAGRLADVMAAASSNANTNVEMMGQTFKYAAPLAGALGYSMEDTAVAIGLMANSGIKADQAGTSLRSVLSRLADPTSEVTETMDALGVSMTDAEGNVRPFNDLIKDFQGSFSKLSETEKVEAASNIAGKNAMSGFLAIVNAAPEDMEKLTDAVYNSDGAAQQMAETMQDNLAGSLTILQSEWESAQIALSEGDFSGFLTNIETVFSHVGEIVTQQAPIVIDGVMDLIDMVTQKLPALLTEIAPTVVNGVVDIFMYLMENAGLLVQECLNVLLTVANAVIDRLPDILISIVDGIMGILLTLSDPENLKKIQDTFMKLLFTLVDAIPEIVEGLANSLPLIIENVVSFFLDPKNLLMLAKAAVKLFIGLVQAVPKILGSLLGAFGNLFGKLFEFIGSFAGGIGEFFAGIWDNIVQFFTPVVDFVRGIIDNVMNIIRPIAEFIGGIFNTIWSIVSGIFIAIVALVTTVMGTIFNVVSNVVGTIVNAIRGFIGTVMSVVGAIVGWVSNNIINPIANFVSGVINTIVNGVRGFVNTVFSIIGTIAGWIYNNVISPVANFFSGLWNGIQAGVQGLKNVIEGIFSTIAGIIKAPINGIIGAINGVIGTINSIEVPDWVPFIGGAHANIGYIPTLASGGYATAATMAVIGEAGDEAVLPLDQNTSWAGKLASILEGEMELDASEQRPINIYNTQEINNTMDAEDVGRIMMRAIRRAA